MSARLDSMSFLLRSHLTSLCHASVSGYYILHVMSLVLITTLRPRIRIPYLILMSRLPTSPHHLIMTSHVLPSSYHVSILRFCQQ